MQVKICGLSRPADIAAVNAAQPDYCGFIINFPKSRRNVSLETLRSLRASLDDRIVPVGVFVEQPVALVAALLQEHTISVAQLHGREDNAYIDALRALTDQPVWKAFTVRTEADVRLANESHADLVLLDAGQGSGETFDWALLQGVNRPFALAGGLHAGNLPAAMQTQAVLLDVSSGAETGGQKDAQKINTIVRMIKGA